MTSQSIKKRQRENEYPEKDEVIRMLLQVIGEIEDNPNNVDCAVVIWRDVGVTSNGREGYTTSVRTSRYSVHMWLGLIEMGKALITKSATAARPHEQD